MNLELWGEVGPELFPVLWMTIKLTIASAIGSLILGTPLTVIRVSLAGILRTLSTWCISIARNTLSALIVLLVSMGPYYNLGLLLAAENDPFIAKQNFRFMMLALVAYTSYSVAEPLRTGTNAVPFGQAEATRSLGLSFGQSFRYTIFPQAFRGAIVSSDNTLIALTKNTTTALVVNATEALLLMKTMTENYTGGILIIFGIIVISFIILTLPTNLFLGWADKRWAMKR